MNNLPLFEGDARETFKKRCRSKGIKFQTLLDLVSVELELGGKGRRMRGITERFDEILDEALNSKV